MIANFNAYRLSRFIGTMALALCSLAEGHEYVSFIGSSPSAVAVLSTTCFDDGNGPPASLLVNVRGNMKTNYLITASVQTGSISGTTTDRVSGDRRPSPLIEVKGGASTYTITISKTKKKPRDPLSRLKGKDTFLLTYHCWSTTNQHTGTTEIYRSR